MYAIIETCGKQYKVQIGDVVYFEKLDIEEGKKAKFENVLLISDETVNVGNPYIKGAVVEGTVLEHGKGKKVIVFKYKAKKNYRKKQGHRQPFTKIKIEKITVKIAKTETVKEEKAEKVEKSKEKPVAKTTTKKATTAKTPAKKTTTKATTTKTTTAKKTTTKKAE